MVMADTEKERRIKRVDEGEVSFKVPDVCLPEAGFAFYNPRMCLARDISVAAIPQEFSFCDLLAACGARGLRLAKEKNLSEVTLMDKNPSAVCLMKSNAEDNGLTEHVRILLADANSALYGEGRFYDCIDIDPFGSPIPFLDAGARFSRRMLNITATDTAALCGVYPKVAHRRYQSLVPCKTSFFHEVGLRVLAGHAVRTVARYDIALVPILAHSSDHYYRIYFAKSEGAGRADAALTRIGFLHFCKSCLYRTSSASQAAGVCPQCKESDLLVFGPLLLGGLWDKDFCSNALAECCERGFSRASKLLGIIIGEADLPEWHYNVHELCSKLRIGPPKSQVLIERLEAQGFRAARTHFDLRGFRTDASLEEINNVLCELGVSQSESR